MIRLRNAQFSDYAAIAKLHSENWKETYRGILSDHYLDFEVEKDRLDTWYKRLKSPPDNQFITIAMSDDLIVGFCCVYLNDDPGSGRTLGFYMEKNEAAKMFFDRWLAPLRDLGMTMNVMEGIGSTDHVPFVQAGMPAFNAIKDFDAYDVRTRHTNADFPERMSEAELTQQAVVMATFAWQAAMMKERMPRLPQLPR